MIRIGYGQRLGLLGVLAGCGGLALLTRLVELQIAEHEHWERQAEGQAAGWRPVRARRGRILDARGEVLAADEAGFDLVVRAAAWEGRLFECAYCGTRRYLRQDQAAAAAASGAFCPRCRHRGTLRAADRRDLRPLAGILGVSSAELEARVHERVEQARQAVVRRLKDVAQAKYALRERREWADQGWRPRVVARDIPYEAAREVAIHPERNPAFKVEAVPSRRLPGGAAFAHIVGRVRFELHDVYSPDRDRWRSRHPVGRSGLELRYDEELTGLPGWIQVLRDPRHRTESVFETREPHDGADLRLTICAADQRRAAAVLSGLEGALVVVNATTGAVLAMATSPSYDPDRYARTVREWLDRQREYGITRGTPLIERACRSFHTPGSILKPFTAIAALDAGIATPETHVVCDGSFHRADGTPLRSHRCHEAHGDLDLHGALVRSCNVYLQTLMREMLARGLLPQFVRTCARFGFGHPTGIEIEPARPRNTFVIPRAWGLRIASAIGQGEITTSPAQVARAYAGLMTGYLPRLHLVESVGGVHAVVERQAVGLPDRVLEPVRAALREVPRSGTARGYGLAALGVACKTGTAQTGRRDEHHSWLAGYAPARGSRPAIAFAIVALNTRQSTGELCGPRLARFLRRFYRESPE